MPKQTYKIQQFHGGLNSDSDPRDLIEGQSPSLVDCAIDSVGRLKLMGATTEVDGSFATAPLSTKNRGLFVMSSDRQLGGSSSDETLIFSYDSGSSKIDAKDSTASADGWDADVITPGGAIDPVYYAADGVVRVADKAFSQSTRWFGYITDQRFDDLNGDSAAIGWYDTNQSIAAPTAGKCLISTSFEDSDTNGVNSAYGEYIGNVIDGTAAANPEVAEGNAVNLRVGIQYSKLLPDTASDVSSTGHLTESDDTSNEPYVFFDNNLSVVADGTSIVPGSLYDNPGVSSTDDVFSVDDGSSFAVPFFITSGRQYDDLDYVQVGIGVATGSPVGRYQYRFQKDEITPDCWNLLVCAKGMQTFTSSPEELGDWGDDLTQWGVYVRRKGSGEKSNHSPSFKTGTPCTIPASVVEGFPPGIYTFHYTWLYDDEHKQESLPYQFGDIDTTYSGEHDLGSDSTTLMTDSTASFVTDQLIGRLIKNTTSGAEGVITDNDGTTVLVASLKFGDDAIWDGTSADDDYEIPPANVNKLCIVGSPAYLTFDVYTIPKPSGAYGINKRISGARLYWKVEENDSYFLLGELDFIDKGFKWIHESDKLSYDMTNTSDPTGDFLEHTALLK